MRTCSRSHDLTQTADAVSNSGLVNYISLGGASRGVFVNPSTQEDFRTKTQAKLAACPCIIILCKGWKDSLS